MKDFMGSLSRLILGIICMGFLLGAFLVETGIAVKEEHVRENATFSKELNKKIGSYKGEIGVMIVDSKMIPKRIIWKSERKFRMNDKERVGFLIYVSGAFPRNTEEEFIYPLICKDKAGEDHISYVVARTSKEIFVLKGWRKILTDEGLCPSVGTIYQIKPTE